MHPRNPYQTPPDFKELALKFPEFRKFAKQVTTYSFLHMHSFLRYAANYFL